MYVCIGVATRGAKGTRAPHFYFSGGLAPQLLKIDILNSNRAVNYSNRAVMCRKQLFKQNVLKIVLIFYLRRLIFQKFPVGACPQTP